MEQIQDHPIQDIWRVKPGLLVVINKYERIGSWLSVSSKQTKVVRGCKGLRVLTEDFHNQYEKVSYLKGTYLFGTAPVKPISDYRKFKVEVKSSGGTIEGSLKEVQDVMSDIDVIMAKYMVQLD